MRLRALIDGMTDPIPYIIGLVAAELDEEGIGDDSELVPSAVKILGERRDARAVPVLARAVDVLDGFDEQAQAIDALVAIGEPVLEVCLARIAAADESHEGEWAEIADHHAWCEVVSRIGIADERIFDALVRAFPEYPSFIAGCLADYGDRRALPLLHGELGRMRVRGYLPHDRWIVEVADAIEQLGDTLTADEERKRAVARNARAQPDRFPRSVDSS